MLGAIIGGLARTGASLFNANRNLKFQKDSAKNSIQWKVEDAKKAGINPIYAVGAPSFSPSPVSLDTAGLSEMGQGIDRAVAANSTRAQQGAQYEGKVAQLNVERLSLENELLRSRIMQVRQSGQTPIGTNPGAGPMLVPGQPSSTVPGVPGVVVDRALKRGATDPEQTWREGAAFPERSWLKVPGGYVPSKSEDAARRLEDDHFGNLLFGYRNYIMDMAGFGEPPRAPLPKGEKWVYDLPTQRWRPHRRYFGVWVPDYMYSRRRR